MNKSVVFRKSTDFLNRISERSENSAKFNDQAVLKGREWRYGEQISGYVFEQRYCKGDMMGVPDALLRATSLRYVSRSNGRYGGLA